MDATSLESTLLVRCPTLAGMFASSTAESATGETIPLNSAITIKNASRLHSRVLDARPLLVLEIGLAHGISALAILSALETLGAGELVSIDPHEHETWRGAGCRAIERAGFSNRHRLISAPDYLALPDLLARGRRFDFAYIDGMHTFDHVFLDFFYIDKLLEDGGVVGFNDCGMPAVAKVIRFVETHKRYAEVDPVPLSWRQRRKLRFWEHPDRYFQKLADEAIPWDYYYEF